MAEAKQQSEKSCLAAKKVRTRFLNSSPNFNWKSPWTFFLHLGQEHWHALHNPLQEEHLLHCVLKVFALEVFDVLLILGCVRDSRLEPGNMLGVQLPPSGV